MHRRSAVFPLVLIVASAVITAGCGSDDDGDSRSDSGTNEPTATSGEETTTAQGTGLVGEWRTENVCQEQLRVLQKAGLDKFVPEAVAGAEYPGQRPTESDPCRGAKPMQHSHSFGEFFDGSFASYDQNGQQVDDGSYITVDDRTFTLAKPPVAVHYRIEGDKATFDVVIPDCKTRQCQESTAYVISVFFPRVYERAD